MDKAKLSKAIGLARYLIEEKGVIKQRAYIVSAKHFGLGQENWHNVQKGFNQKYNIKRIIKSKVKQIGLF